jgi:hypothetical protein
MNTRRRLTAAGQALIGALTLSIATALPCLGSLGVATADEPTPPPARVPGVWQKHQYSFQYMGFTTTYSCDGLADKLKVLLLAAGARADVKSQAGACASGYGRPDKFARADLTFYTLQPLANGAVNDLAAANNRQAAQAKRVDGIWRPVAFASWSPRQLHVGDCELVEQFRNQLLPMFATRSVESGTTCVPYQQSGSVINLKFESLAAAPAPAAGAAGRR